MLETACRWVKRIITVFSPGGLLVRPDVSKQYLSDSGSAGSGSVETSLAYSFCIGVMSNYHERMQLKNRKELKVDTGPKSRSGCLV